MGLVARAAKIAAVACFAVISIEASASESLRVQLNWTADSAHLGFATAQARGIYKKYNLDVTFVEGRGSTLAVQMAAIGQVDLAYADTVTAFKLASLGAPIKVVSTIWKLGQFGILSLRDSRILKPQDLAGKKIAVSPNSAMLPLMSAFLRVNKISPNDVTIVNAAENAFVGLLTSKQVDAVSQTPEKIALPLAKLGIDVNVMYFHQYGMPLVSLGLIAREDRIATMAPTIQRFNQATAEGWLFAMQNHQLAINDLQMVFPETATDNSALMQASAYSYASVCPGGSGDIIGVTEDRIWSNIYGVITSAMDLPTDKPASMYYTNSLAPLVPVKCP